MSPVHTQLTTKEQIERLRALEFATTMRVLRVFPEEQLEMSPKNWSSSCEQIGPLGRTNLIVHIALYVA